MVHVATKSQICSSVESLKLRFIQAMKENMDDGNSEVSDKLSDNVLFSNPDSCSNFQASTSMNTDTELPKSTTKTCTHTHTCNPPGFDFDDSIHTHTCFHTHTHVFASEDDTDSRPKRTSGNREAVKKYREKKKAQTAYLEEEVKKLKLVNQQLMRRLQGQSLLEAELLRLRNTLVQLKGKVDCELGSFPFQKKCFSSSVYKGDANLVSASQGIDLELCSNDTSD